MKTLKVIVSKFQYISVLKNEILVKKPNIRKMSSHLSLVQRVFHKRCIHMHTFTRTVFHIQFDFMGEILFVTMHYVTMHYAHVYYSRPWKSITSIGVLKIIQLVIKTIATFKITRCRYEPRRNETNEIRFVQHDFEHGRVCAEQSLLIENNLWSCRSAFSKRNGSTRGIVACLVNVSEVE